MLEVGVACHTGGGLLTIAGACVSLRYAPDLTLCGFVRGGVGDKVQHI
jgi:hypothetical protein